MHAAAVLVALAAPLLARERTALLVSEAELLKSALERRRNGRSPQTETEGLPSGKHAPGREGIADPEARVGDFGLVPGESGGNIHGELRLTEHLLKAHWLERKKESSFPRGGPKIMPKVPKGIPQVDPLKKQAQEMAEQVANSAKKAQEKAKQVVNSPPKVPTLDANALKGKAEEVKQKAEQSIKSAADDAEGNSKVIEGGVGDKVRGFEAAAKEQAARIRNEAEQLGVKPGDLAEDVDLQTKADELQKEAKAKADELQKEAKAKADGLAAKANKLTKPKFGGKFSK